MKATAIFSRLVGWGVVLVAMACGRSPSAPSPIDSSGGPPGQTTFTIIDGWSRAPVPGAAVTANSQQALTDASGEVRFPVTSSSCMTVGVMATGYLERRTCGSASNRQITLWPIASADEAEVTRQWVFTNDQIRGDFWSGLTSIALSPELASRADVVEAWTAATDVITQVSHGRIQFQWVASVREEGLLVEATDTPPSCSVVPPWPFEVAGFCVTYDPVVYYLDRLQVKPDRLVDRSTVLRALLSALKIRAHTLPGLLNLTRPEAELSEFERKTLGMLGLRSRTVMWPDFDQIQ